VFLQSFVRARRKADVIATRNILGHDDVDAIHGCGIGMARRRPVVLDSGRLRRADFASIGKLFYSDGLSQPCET
jgi:hypothetical protein